MAAPIALDDRLGMQTITSDLVIRPIARADRERLAEAFSAFGEDTRRGRFGRHAERAGDGGSTRLLAYVDVDNHPVLGWLGRAGAVAVAHDGEAIVFAIPLDRPGEQRRA